MTLPAKPHTPPQCPSAHVTDPDAVVFGLVTGSPEAPRIGYLTEALPVTEDLLARAGSANPGQVFRAATACIGLACRHNDGIGCRLAQRVVIHLDPVVNGLPACQIRPTCVWFRQEGKAACLRCPQVISAKPAPAEEYRLVGEPNYGAQEK